MEVKIIHENEIGNGESSVEFDFVYTPAGLVKASKELHKPRDSKFEESF